MRKKKEAGFHRNRGTVTVEATVILPILLMIIAAAILLYVTLGRREVLRGEMYKALYTIGIADELDGDPNAVLRDRTPVIAGGSENVSVASEGMGDLLLLRGTVGYLKQPVMKPLARFRSRLHAVTARERDLCSERLRRWKFYGDLTEKSGD